MKLLHLVSKTAFASDKRRRFRVAVSHGGKKLGALHGQEENAATAATTASSHCESRGRGAQECVSTARASSDRRLGWEDEISRVVFDHRERVWCRKIKAGA